MLEVKKTKIYTCTQWKLPLLTFSCSPSKDCQQLFPHTVQTERQYSEETTKIHKQVKDTHTHTHTHMNKSKTQTWTKAKQFLLVNKQFQESELTKMQDSVWKRQNHITVRKFIHHSTASVIYMHKTTSVYTSLYTSPLTPSHAQNRTIIHCTH